MYNQILYLNVEENPIIENLQIEGIKKQSLVEFLKDKMKGFLGTESVKWNFSKFLLSRDGAVEKRYGSLDFPEAIEPDIKKLLDA